MSDRTASERAGEFMDTKTSMLPDLAVQFRDKMIREHAACAEIFIMAFTIYAHIAEGLPGCSYEITDEVRAWFAYRMQDNPEDGLATEIEKDSARHNPPAMGTYRNCFSSIPRFSRQ